MAKTYSTPQKSSMKKQRDPGGFNRHGANHPNVMGNQLIKPAPKLPQKGLTPSKDRTRP